MTEQQPDERLEAMLRMLESIASLDFSSSLAISDKADDMDAVASGLNMLCQELEANVVRRSQLEEIVADLEASRLQLEKQKERLAHSNAELQQFAYAASHDLQEPLRAVSNFAQLLSREYKGQLDQEADTYIGFVTDGARRMKELIDDLLEVSLLDAEARKFAPISSQVLVEEAISNLDTAIRESSAEVTFDSLPTVFGDAKHLTSVFQNLISNAIKFRRASEVPKVYISAVRHGRLWTFSVRDNGIGIQENHLERVFVIFKRLHTRTAYGGTGIGLALAQKIVQGHGGRIWVESEPDKGSTFFFTLPTDAIGEGVTR